MESERLAGSHSEPSKPVSGKGFSPTAAPCLPQPCPTRGTRHRPGTLDPLGVHLKGAQSLSAQSLLQPPTPPTPAQTVLGRRLTHFIYIRVRPKVMNSVLFTFECLTHRRPGSAIYWMNFGIMKQLKFQLPLSR